MTWTALNRSEYKVRQLPNSGSSRSFVSPYDIPEAFRVYWTNNKTVLVIEFKFMVDEPKTELIGSSAISFKVGKNSRRVYQIAVDRTKLDADSKLDDVLSKALEKMASQASNEEVDDSRWVTRRLVETEHEKLELAWAH